MKPSHRRYTFEDVQKIRRNLDVFAGVAVDYELAGPDGARFIMVWEPSVTYEQLKSAEAMIRMSQDVVGAVEFSMVEMGPLVFDGYDANGRAMFVEANYPAHRRFIDIGGMLHVRDTLNFPVRPTGMNTPEVKS